MKSDQAHEIPCYQPIRMFQRIDKCLKGRYKCCGRWNSILHVKLSVRTMLWWNSREAEELFRYANEMFMKAKSNIRNWRNVAPWDGGVLWNICCYFEYSLSISLQRKDEPVWCWHAFIDAQPDIQQDSNLFLLPFYSLPNPNISRLLTQWSV